jgi:spore maturation protein CgeB
MLDQLPYFKVWGRKDYFGSLKSYQGIFPEEHKYAIGHVQNDGMILVLHSAEHILSSVPSGRIFEAAAASAVIISDRHPFVVREFGDSVLYIDQNASVEEMYKQIVQHVEWIHSHPKEAEKLARKSHHIFVDKFTLEKQFDKIIEAHEQYIKNK